VCSFKNLEGREGGGGGDVDMMGIKVVVRKREEGTGREK
jgi:hypothetical protein